MYVLPRRERRLTEYNGCHDPKDGLFSPKGQGDCEPGDWSDPGRNRSVYGQEAPGSLELSKAENRQAREHIGDTDDDRGDVKADIARTLGSIIEEHPDFEKFQRAFEDEIASAPGGGQNMDDAHSEYESWSEDQREEQDEAFRDQAFSEWRDHQDKAQDAVISATQALQEIWEESREERFGAYGDTSLVKNLPGFEDMDPGGKALDPGQFFKDTLLDGEQTGKWDGDEWRQHLDGLDFEDPEFRNRLRTEMAQYGDVDDADFLKDDPRNFALTVLDGYSKYFDDGDGDGSNNFIDDGNAGEVEYDYDSFETWYADNHGGNRPRDDAGDGERVASWLVHKWADTSGDGDEHSVMLQEAAVREFQLGATYAGVFNDRGGGGDSNWLSNWLKNAVEKHLKNHGPFLQHFLRTMYNNTQAKLKAQGITHVTLYRGFAIAASREKGMGSVNAQGDFVDVLMQPMSSFSSDYSTAANFGGHGAGTPYMMGVRVPIERVIGTARTGFGALNESEFVVLGGRQPAFVTERKHKMSPTQSDAWPSLLNIDRFWERFEHTQRRRKSPLTSGGVVVGPGDRL